MQGVLQLSPQTERGNGLSGSDAGVSTAVEQGSFRKINASTTL